MNLSASCPNLLEAADIPTTVAGVSVLTPNLPPYDGDQEEDDSAHSFVKRQPAKRWPRGLPRRFSHDQVPVIIISSEAKLTEAASAEGTSERDDKSYLGKSMEVSAAVPYFGCLDVCVCVCGGGGGGCCVRMCM